jgi:hypothetical protein
MAKKTAEPAIKPVRPLDPAWRIKFKSTKELSSNKKTNTNRSSKVNPE